MYPEIYVEMNLIFDNDFDVDEITKITAIEPSNVRHRDKNVINPITQRPMESWWEVKSSVFSCHDVTIVLQDLISKIDGKLEKIADICSRNNGIVDFCVVAYFEAENKPALYFERDFLDIVERLHATIQMDLYIV